MSDDLWTEILKARVKVLREFARNIANNYDHDEDAHRHGTRCRICDAEEVLRETE